MGTIRLGATNGPRIPLGARGQVKVGSEGWVFEGSERPEVAVDTVAGAVVVWGVVETLLIGSAASC